MELLIPFALKSLLIAGVTLGLLHLLKARSASERSMVAHFGLLALLLLPIGSMVLPQLIVEAPIVSAPSSSQPVAAPTSSGTDEAVASAGEAAATVAPSSFDPVSLWPLFYGFPAAVLLAVTLLAVLRLLALRAKATVLVEPSWLSAMAHAQRRMGFKHGTALLTSSELHSPISWGVLRPVILLNDEALEARHEAEAIIAHELAHVRGLDWAKLLMARAVTAIFWFNPLVWILAREAHQLREETADDAVLAANVESADYAQLLVGVARHDCKGLLLGAHGVAPGRGSLTRRVRRVLDASLPRTPVARGFAAGMALGVVAAAAPLAAVTFAPTAPDTSKRYYVGAPQPKDSLPSVVAQSVVGATVLTGEVVRAHVNAALTGKAVETDALERRIEQQVETRLAYTHPHPPLPPAPPAPVAEPRRVARDADSVADEAVERMITAKAFGITPDYAARIRAAAPGLRIDDDDLVGLRAVGVTPEWLGAMSRAGYRASDVGDLTGARAVGISPSYVAEMAAVGYRGIDLGDLTALKALGVTGSYVRELRASGITGLSPQKLIELRAHGIKASAFRRGPRPPAPPGRVGPEPPEPPAVEEPDIDHDSDE